MLESTANAPAPPAAAPAAAASPMPTYPRVQHSKWMQILIWLNCGALLICGFLTFIFSCIKFSRLSHVFLGFYLAMFGAMVICAELRLPFAQRCFGFLCTKLGLAVFFIFAGTLGISFGVGKSPGVLIPFIYGIFGVLIGALCITDKVIVDKTSTTAASVEAV